MMAQIRLSYIYISQSNKNSIICYFQIPTNIEIRIPNIVLIKLNLLFIKHHITDKYRALTLDLKDSAINFPMKLIEKIRSKA